MEYGSLSCSLGGFRLSASELAAISQTVSDYLATVTVSLKVTGTDSAPRQLPRSSWAPRLQSSKLHMYKYLVVDLTLLINPGILNGLPRESDHNPRSRSLDGLWYFIRGRH